MEKNSHSQLAILIGASHTDESAIHHDLAAMYTALTMSVPGSP